MTTHQILFKIAIKIILSSLGGVFTLMSLKQMLGQYLPYKKNSDCCKIVSNLNDTYYPHITEYNSSSFAIWI